MINYRQIIQELIIKTDLEWFDAMCNLLEKNQYPTFSNLSEILGPEAPNPNNEIRGGYFIEPFDKRFDRVYLNPSKENASIENLGFYGKNFHIKAKDIIERFSFYRLKSNIYDGGTQIFFHPVPDVFEFSAIESWTSQESENISDVNALIFNSVYFQFGEILTESKTGFFMKRK